MLSAVNMKRLMLLGGLLGFLLGLACGLAQGNRWPVILWHASAMAFGAGLLLRWWGAVCLTGLKEARSQRAPANPKPATAPLAAPSKS